MLRAWANTLLRVRLLVLSMYLVDIFDMGKARKDSLICVDSLFITDHFDFII